MPDVQFAPEPITALLGSDGFDCGQTSLNDWLTKRALKNHLEGYTHVRVIAESGQVIGYYGLASATVIPDAMPRAERGGQPPDPAPAILIGRFAVDRKRQGQGLGRILFRDALVRCLAASDMVGARAVVIHALDPKAAAFYRTYDFVATLTDPLTLYQSMQRIRAALSS